MDSIRERFLQAEQDFLHAVRSGNQALTDFADSWDRLQSDWDSYRGAPDSTTQQLVDAVVARIESLAGDFYNFESRSMSLEDDLLNSLEDVFASLSLEDPISSEPVQPINTLPSTGTITTPAQWLLHNLHNPYPLPHLRFLTIRDSKHARDWFAKARQRIGWTRLLRDRFAGCRTLATDAAFRAFVRDDPKNPLDSDLKTAFLAIRSHAELVYGNEDDTPYILPKRLRSISPTPSLTSASGCEDSDSEQSSVPSPRSTPERPLKRSSLDSSDIRSSKRRRSHEPPLFPQFQNQTANSSVHVNPPLPSKKRRLSEGDTDSSRPKRRRGMEGDRLQTVSNPLTPSTASAWFDFDQSFQIPNPASTDPLEPTVFDLDFFNPPSLSSYAVSPLPVPSFDTAVPESDLSTLFEIPQLDLSQLGFPTFDSDWARFSNFEPNFSLFPYPPSLASSLAGTPSLIDDAILTPSHPPLSGGPSSPDPLSDIPPHVNDKNIRFPIVGEPMIQGQDFLLSPGEGEGIPSATALLLSH